MSLAAIDLAGVLRLRKGSPAGADRRPVVPGPAHLQALRLAGTSNLYVDAADPEEIARVAETSDGGLAAEVDGNTVNQPLMSQVLERELEDGVESWLRELAARHGGAREALLPLAYAAASVSAGARIVERFTAGRSWQISLQLPMSSAADASQALELGRQIHRALPGALIKVPFRPHEPGCVLAARDLERAGIPVNFTSTFSARQAALAALLTGATRTNVFAGRLNQGLSAQRLGEDVALEAQRLLVSLRRELGVRTHLIVASVRAWRTFVETAGCDAFTAPAAVYAAFLAQTEVAPDQVESRLATTVESALGIAPEIAASVPRARIERLQQVEPELLDFLRDYRQSREYRDLRDGAGLRRRFEEAGCGDVFHTPDAEEWSAIRAGKIPDLRSPVAGRIALDTLFSLHADADFEQHQARMDERLLAALGGRAR